MPHKNGERLRLLDILRGIAILGTLGTNIWIFAHLGNINYVYTSLEANWWSSIEHFIRILVLFLVNGKLLGILTMLFGVGLAMKFKQAMEGNSSWPKSYIWIGIFLMCEGLIHYTLVMEYDILMSYGVTAIVVAYIVQRGENIRRRWMYWSGSIHGVMIMVILLYSLWLALNGEHLPVVYSADIVSVYTSGTWLEQVSYRVVHFFVFRAEAIFILPMNIFLFLLGFRLFEAGYFANNAEGREKRGKLLRYGLLFGLPLNALIFIPGGYFDYAVRYLFAPILSLGYIGLIAKLYEVNTRLWLWQGLERIGKMALSSYILQNIVASTIFYGWGLGLGNTLSSLQIVMVWLSICALQLIIAVCWLSYFKLGPIEWIRRSLLNVLGNKY